MYQATSTILFTNTTLHQQSKWNHATSPQLELETIYDGDGDGQVMCYDTVKLIEQDRQV